MENTNFWSGFAKEARKAQHPDNIGGRIKKTQDAAAITGVVTLGAMAAGAMVDETLSPQERDKLITDVSHHFKIPKPSVTEVGHDFMSAYHPGEHSIRVAPWPKQGIVSHELGHASSKAPATGMLSKLRRSNFNVDGITRRLYSLPAVGLLSGDEKVRNMAAPASLLLAAPTLIEEGVATTQALKALHKTRGLRSAARAAPGLLGAFSTYASVPLGIHFANKWIVGKRKKRSE